MTDIILFAFGIGLCLGLWLSNYLWATRIREKAEQGIRLEVSGVLYNVTVDRK